MTRLPSSCLSETPFGRWLVTVPFGPFTITLLPSTEKETPFGIGIGFLPIRDIRFFSYTARGEPGGLPDRPLNGLASSARIERVDTSTSLDAVAELSKLRRALRRRRLLCAPASRSSRPLAWSGC